MSAMGAYDLLYLSFDPDRHGNPRYYVRLPNKPRYRMQSEPNTEDFTNEYWAVRNGEIDPAKINKKKKRAPAKFGTFAHLVLNYYQSPEFKAYDKETQLRRKNFLEGIADKFGGLPALIETETLQLAVDRRVSDGQPWAANNFIKMMKALYQWAFEEGLVDGNPVLKVKFKKPKSAGFHSLTLAEFKQYCSIHPEGTQARLALLLGVFTGARASDLHKLGRRNEEDGWLTWKQHKGRENHPMTVYVPILGPLKQEIDRSGGKGFTYLENAYGKPYSLKGYQNRIKKWFAEADLEHCSSHSMRKGAGKLLAEFGCTTKEIQAILGHTTLKQAELYTMQAERKQLAKSGMEKFESGMFGEQSVALFSKGTKK